MIELIFDATFDTIVIVLISFSMGLVLGVPIAAFLFVSKHISQCKVIWLPIDILVNFIRSLPYIILVIALIPITRFVVGSSIGTIAASFPLGIAATALIVRIVYEAFLTVPKEILELALTMKASKLQTVVKFVIPEALPGIIGGLTIVVVNLICYSAMAGMVGGGGLGDLAIRYGYQRYDYVIMFQVIVILVGIVQAVQFIGNWLSAKIRK